MAADRSDVDLEKGSPYEPNSHTGTATTTVPKQPQSETATGNGPLSGERSSEEEEREEKKDPNIVTWDGPDDPREPQELVYEERPRRSHHHYATWLLHVCSRSPWYPRSIPRGFARRGHFRHVRLHSRLRFRAPLIIAPTSEIYGRAPLYNAGTVLFTIFSVCTARLRKETGNMQLRSQYAGNASSVTEKFKLAIVCPVKLLSLTPIVTLMALYVAIIYGILYLLYSTFSLVYPEYYGFNEGESGLVFIPSAIGMSLSMINFGILSDRLVTRKLSSGEKHRPEIRLTPFFTLPVGFAIPAGLFIYGWTIQYHVHWIVPMIGVVIFAFGLMGINMCIQNYLLDVYPCHAASVTAAMTVLRSLTGALLPLCALDMYAALGLGWGNSLLAFLALGLVPIPTLFYIFGPRLVKRFNPKL
ncbi:hypothetical protein VTK26DRAFT_6650 [Humicola hyalothermophila]